MSNDNMSKDKLERHLKTVAGSFSPCAMIIHNKVKGFAYLIGENWSREWQSGDIAVIWEDGDLTVLPQDFEVLKLDAWSLT